VPRWTIAQALAALAMELDPELYRALAADGVDRRRFFAEPPSMLGWSPETAAFRLFERKRRLRVELVRRLQEHTWRLFWLSDDPSQDARPFVDDHLAELTPQSLDPEKSVVILGGRHYRVRIEITEQPAVAAPPKKPGRPPRLDVRERMRADLKEQPNGEWRLIDERGRPIAQEHWQKRYNAAASTCAKALVELMTEIRKSADRN
jgi:hypothetical protein